jgi:hypothetical protein
LLECFVQWRAGMRIRTTWLISLCAAGALACGEGADGATADARGGSDVDGGTAAAGTFGGGPGTGSAGTGAADGGVPNLPPEVEEMVDFQLPQASENFVYAANPAAGTVAVIDAQTSSIRTLETGEQPTYLRTLPGTDDAIVLNVGSDTATVIRSAGTSSKTSDLPVVPGANAIGLAPDGKHAVVYYNSSYASAGNTSGSFQDVSVVSLSQDGDDDQALSMTVGFRPRDVFFSSDGARAFVVTEDGISVLDFAAIAKTGSGIAQLLSFGGQVDQKTLDVAVTPDGRYALARADGTSLLRLIDLNDGHVKTLDVADAYVAPPATDDDDAGVAEPPPIAITDLDLVPTGDAAIVVLRNQSAMMELPIPGAFDDATEATTLTVEDQIVGSVSVSPDGKHALLYTTVANQERMTLVVRGGSTEPKTVALRKAVQAVVFTPDGKTALITHTKLPGSPDDLGISPDESIDRAYGYSLLRVPQGDVKLQVTRTAVGPAAIVPDGSYVFVLFRDDALGIKEVHRVALASFLVDPILELESPPISIGSAPKSGRVFVNQDHPDGRMLFIDWQNPRDRNTVTGFELNSRIRD